MRVWVWSVYENGNPDPYPAVPYPQPTGVSKPMIIPSKGTLGWPFPCSVWASLRTPSQTPRLCTTSLFHASSFNLVCSHIWLAQCSLTLADLPMPRPRLASLASLCSPPLHLCHIFYLFMDHGTTFIYYLLIMAPYYLFVSIMSIFLLINPNPSREILTLFF